MKTNYRAAVGPEENYDILGAHQFMLLVMLGLREKHKLLDIGCGSLRAGRFLIPYLNAGNYYGIEPNEELVWDGYENELGGTILRPKLPNFAFNSSFIFTDFDRRVTFDFVLAQSIFSHTPIKLLKKCFQNLNKVVHNGTIFAFTYMPGDNSNQNGSEWVADGKVVSWHPEAFRRYITEICGWFMFELKWRHPSGQRWCVATRSVVHLEIPKGRLRQWSGQIYR